MRPGSLLGILLELLEGLEARGSLPADALVGRFFRERRFLGALDRRLIAAAAYGWLRHRSRGEARWEAWAARTGLTALSEPAGRVAPLGALLALARDSLLPWSQEEILAAARELEPPLPGWWAANLARVRDGPGPEDWPREPMARLAAELSLPEWIARRLVDERGEEEARILGEALLREAPLDLRVNPARASREEAAAEIERGVGVGAVRLTPWSPLGLRLFSRKNLGRFMASHRGWIEVQDEGSQLAVLAADLEPGETVIDACAGSGGKTLALLDLLEARLLEAGGARRRGKVHACDVRADKLQALHRRARGRDLRRLTVHRISPQGPLPAELPQADLVLVDAPCSGSGTLRRAPELKHRLAPEDLGRFAALEGAILRRFAPWVRAGGRLVYSTCSVFEEENGAVVDAFLREEPGFEEVPSPWAEAHLPPSARRGPRLRLDPISTGTDGFFVAILRRGLASRIRPLGARNMGASLLC